MKVSSGPSGPSGPRGPAVQLGDCDSVVLEESRDQNPVQNTRNRCKR